MHRATRNWTTRRTPPKLRPKSIETMVASKHHPHRECGGVRCSGAASLTMPSSASVTGNSNEFPKLCWESRRRDQPHIQGACAYTLDLKGSRSLSIPHVPQHPKNPASKAPRNKNSTTSTNMGKSKGDLTISGSIVGPSSGAITPNNLATIKQEWMAMGDDPESSSTTRLPSKYDQNMGGEAQLVTKRLAPQSNLQPMRP